MFRKSIALLMATSGLLASITIAAAAGPDLPDHASAQAGAAITLTAGCDDQSGQDYGVCISTAAQAFGDASTES